MGLFANAMTLGGNQGFPPINNGEMLGPVNLEIALTEAPKQRSAEELVREYFKDTPELVAVAWCESRFRQFDGDGNIHRGEVNNNDIGLTQINTVYHLERANQLKLDIFTLEGNMAYAKYLYEEEGLQPWSASKPCWERYLGRDVQTIAFAER